MALSRRSQLASPTEHGSASKGPPHLLGHAPCDSFSSMRRLTVVVGGCALPVVQKQCGYLLLSDKRHAILSAARDGLLFTSPTEHGSASKGMYQRTPDRKCGSLYVSLPHPPSVAQSARGFASGTPERTLLFFQRHETACCSWRTCTLRFFQQHEVTYCWCRWMRPASRSAAMWRLTLVGQAPYYSLSIRRLAVVGQEPCYSFSSIRWLTVHLTHRARLDKQGGRTSESVALSM